MGRSVEVDVAELERLYFAEGLNTRQVGERLGCSPNTVQRRIRELARKPRAPGKPEKYPPVELGVCGTPGCTDPACDVPYGTCHCACGAETRIATRHDRLRGYVKGKHERFLRAHYDRDREEYRRFHADKMTATMNGLMSDPRRKAEWQMSRHSYPGLPKNTRGFGVLGASDGIEAGRAKGGRRPKARPEQQQEMLRLDREGYSSREIADQVFGDRRFYKRVQRFLAR
jgi:hypothetical protein